MSTPCIIEVALDGAITMDANPRVPRALAQLAADALLCIDAGATIVHNNNNNDFLRAEGGVHAVGPYIEAWRPVPGVTAWHWSLPRRS